MNQDDRDRLELRMDDASRAIEEARAICRHALAGEPGEYDRLESLAAAAAALELVALRHSAVSRRARVRARRAPGDAPDAIGESLRV